MSWVECGSSRADGLAVNPLEVRWLETGLLGDTGQHLRSDFFRVAIGEDVVRPTWSGQNPVGTTPPELAPTDSLKRA